VTKSRFCKFSGRQLALGLFVFLSACQSVPDRRILVTLGPDLEMMLSVPGGAGKEFSAVQMVTGAWKGRSFSQQVQVMKRNGALDFVALDPLGRRAMTIQWQGDQIQATMAPWLPPDLTAQMMMAHFALIYWSGTALSDAFIGDDVIIDDRPGSRRLLQGGRTVIEIIYDPSRELAWNGKARMLNLLLDYKLSVQSKALP